MRMWGVNPKLMCSRHLNGELNEIQNLLINHLNKKRSIKGYIKNNLLEPSTIRKRYNQLRREAKRRGWKHRKDLKCYSISYLPKNERYYKINVQLSIKDLIKRCPECRKRIEKDYRIIFDHSFIGIKLFKRRRI